MFLLAGMVTTKDIHVHSCPKRVERLLKEAGARVALKIQALMSQEGGEITEGGWANGTTKDIIILMSQEGGEITEGGGARAPLKIL